MSMADQNAYMNATDISDEEDLLEEMDGEDGYVSQMEDCIRRNPFIAAAGAFLAGIVVGGICVAAGTQAARRLDW